MTPSPADMARRTKPPRTPQESIAPGHLVDGERFKPTYHRGLLMSGMNPEARLMGFTLLWFANHKTGRISPNFQPSQEELAEATGLSAGRVGVQIEVLRERGWLHLTWIAEGPRTGLPRFDLTIPALYLERVRAHRASHKQHNTESR
ncbi:hypothetical protein [Streptomyces sp. DSM 40484]|uniref:hypothetical protein n=1 Tax=Streptomyces kroppenstedtii TaxID=3051181 RepID=UPI0028D689D4|nr:hypothetical protein [Streptomyces sp. DSM 40484]